MKTVMEVKYVYKKVEGNEILKGVHFDVNSGEIIGLVGENDVQEKTLFKIITGFLEPDAGNVYITGNQVTKENRKFFDDVGCMFEENTLDHSMTGDENIEWICQLCACPYDAYVKNLVVKMKLQNQINNKVKTYSKDAKKRLGIVMALVNKPSLVLLEEPFQGLDDASILEIKKILSDLCHDTGMGILIVSCNLSKVESLCDPILMLQDGEIKEDQ